METDSCNLNNRYTGTRATKIGHFLDGADFQRLCPESEANKVITINQIKATGLKNILIWANHSPTSLMLAQNSANEAITSEKGCRGCPLLNEVCFPVAGAYLTKNHFLEVRRLYKPAVIRRGANEREV